MIDRSRPAEILLVEDSTVDVLMTREALSDSRFQVNLRVAEDGEQALEILRGNKKPDIVLLDLNLPRNNGIEVLQEIRKDPAFCSIPVIVLTTSRSEEDILRAYQLHANCYVAKPLDYRGFAEVVRAIDHFWLSLVTLPTHVPSNG